MTTKTDRMKTKTPSETDRIEKNKGEKANRIVHKFIPI